MHSLYQQLITGDILGGFDLLWVNLQRSKFAWDRQLDAIRTIEPDRISFTTLSSRNGHNQLQQFCTASEINLFRAALHQSVSGGYIDVEYARARSHGGSGANSTRGLVRRHCCEYVR